MSRDTRNDFALAMQRLRADRYVARQFGGELRSIEAAYDYAQATIKDSFTVAHPAPAGGDAGGGK